MKAFISFFFKKPKKKRSVKVAPSNPVHDGGAMSTMATGIGQTVEWEDAAARTSTSVSDDHPLLETGGSTCGTHSPARCVASSFNAKVVESKVLKPALLNARHGEARPSPHWSVRILNLKIAY